MTNPESQERLQKFHEEYVALTEKYDVDLVAVPQFIPQENGTFAFTVQAQMIDKKTLPVKSPLSEVMKKENDSKA